VNTFGDSTSIELRSMIACTFAYAFMTRPAHMQFFTALDSIKEAIIMKYNETASPEKRIDADSIQSVHIKDSPDGQSKNIANLTDRYLPLIKQTIEFDNELGTALQNISDIEIAFQVILTSVPALRRPENGVIITYKDYVQSMNENMPVFSSMPEAFSFKNIMRLLIKTMNAQIDIGSYSGGLTKRRRTRKQRRHLKKTARAAKGEAQSKTYRKKIIRRSNVKRYARTIKQSN
jgi:hypothetical protein